MRRRYLLPLFLVAPALLLAHAGESLEPHDLWRAWEVDPGTAIPLVVAAVLYALGTHRPHGILRWRKVCFWSGWLFLVVALVSPIHPLGEALFSAHMAQHEILILIAAPLLAASRPVVPFLFGLPLNWRRAIGRVTKIGSVQSTWHNLTKPVTAWTLHAAALWIWHAPWLFTATLESDWVHAAQHASFLGTALLFWWSLLYAETNAGTGVLSIFTTAVHTSVLGALLTFSPAVWYPAYAGTTKNWGLTPLEDQQIGGLIMWVPAGVVYMIAGLWFFTAWLRQSEALSSRSQYAE